MKRIIDFGSENNATYSLFSVLGLAPLNSSIVHHFIDCNLRCQILVDGKTKYTAGRLNKN